MQIFTLLLFYVVPVKIKVKISQKFVAFSEYMNFDLFIFSILIALLAAVEVLWEIDEDAVKNCVATAGFSVGEITSLIFSGALTFEDGLFIPDSI